jgi:NitT/TauT family transport system substrate-binding protein
MNYFKPVLLGLIIGLLCDLQYSFTEEKPVVKIAYPSIGGNSTILYVGAEAGIFQRNGLDLKLIYIPGGSRLVQALISGDIDFGFTSPSVAVGASLAGADLQILAVSTTTMVYWLFVTKEVRDLGDLRGKLIGITRYGSGIDVATQAVFRKLGFELNKDYKLIQVGGQREAISAMEKGVIQGALLNPPASTIARSLGFKMLVDGGDLGIDYAMASLVSLKSKISRDEALVRKVVKSYAEAIAFAKKNPEPAIAALGKYTGVKDRRVLKETYEAFVPRFAKIPLVTERIVKAALFENQQRFPKAASSDARVFMETKYIEKLESEGFFKLLYRD